MKGNDGNINVSIIKNIVENELNEINEKIVNKALINSLDRNDRFSLDSPDAKILVISGTNSDNKGHIYLDKFMGKSDISN